jgi:hypothetical protein
MEHSNKENERRKTVVVGGCGQRAEGTREEALERKEKERRRQERQDHRSKDTV